MEKTNMYYTTVYGRANVLRAGLLSLAYGISSYPRLILEVFLRKRMGERYFTVASATTVGIILAAFPFLNPVTRYLDAISILIMYWSWYVFLAAFAFFSWKRYQEIKREPNVFDGGKFTKSTGVSLDFFYTLPNPFKKQDDGEPAYFTIRQIEIYLEPLAVFIPALLLFLISHNLLSVMLMTCAILYSFSNSCAWLEGDHFAMDLLDQQIASEDLKTNFITGEPSKRGFRFYGTKPSTEELRKDFVDAIFDQDFETVVR